MKYFTESSFSYWVYQSPIKYFSNTIPFKELCSKLSDHACVPDTYGSMATLPSRTYGLTITRDDEMVQQLKGT